jgi:glycosyltransferase involved in cell wall biosynthesis
MLLIAYAGAIALYWLIWAWVLARGLRRLTHLATVPPLTEEPMPRVSVVVAARNEAWTIGPALASLLQIDYPALELWVVDDRSTDATPIEIAKLAAQDPRLKVLRLDALPPGWLGKTHALAAGARTASGEWLLFTDADVHFAPDALRRAMQYVLEHGLDHLTANPHLLLEHYGERTLIGTFRVCFNMGVKPWQARDPHSPSALGIGAFNLVRRQAYERAGGHAAVRLAVDDDMRLGRVLKRAGARQDLVYSGDRIQVRWHDGVRATIRGLEKNFFGGFQFRTGMAVVAVAALLVFHTGPAIAVLCARDGIQRGAAVAAWLATAIAYRAAGEGFLTGLGAPLGGVLAAFALARSTAVTLARGGVEWRGTFYSLAELRAFLRADRHPA